MVRSRRRYHDQEDAHSQGPTKRQGQIGNEDENRTSSFERVLVGRFGRRSRRSWVFPSSTKSHNSSRDRHHPEHALDSDARGRRGENATEHYHGRCEDNSNFSTKVIAGQADGDLADDLTDEQGVGDLSADRGGVLLWILFPQEDVGHGPG